MLNKLKPIFIIIFWILLWLIIALITNNSVILPNPIEVIKTILVSAATYSFWPTVFGSMLRIIAGFLVACIIGTAISVVANKFKLIKEFISPVMQFTKSAPIVCFIVILLVWFGVELLDFITVLIAVIPIFYFAVNEALENRDKKIADMLHIYKVSSKTIWRVFEWPGIRPYFNQASKTGIGVSWKSAVTAQMIGIVASTIGEKVYSSKISLDSASLIMWMIIVVILGWLTEKLVVFALDKLTNYWKASIEIDKTNLENSSDKVNNKPILKAENLYKNYKQKEVLKNINIEMQYGDKIALNWNTGAGKSTLLNIIMGIEQPTSGRITINEYTPRTYSCAFQESTLLANLNVEQNIVVASNKADKPFIVDHSLNIPELSGGMKRCVEIERAITADSKIVVLDEPFTGLDENTRNKAIEYINNNLDGRSLIIATHNDKDADKLGCKLLSQKG